MEVEEESMVGQTSFFRDIGYDSLVVTQLGVIQSQWIVLRRCDIREKVGVRLDSVYMKV